MHFKTQAQLSLDNKEKLINKKSMVLESSGVTARLNLDLSFRSLTILLTLVKW